jgi:dTDP-4-dehydrorhamnose reductase
MNRAARENDGPPETPLELWAGFECTLNRVGDVQHDQFELLGHYARPGDIDRLAGLGIRTIRYPILWERMVHASADDARWQWVDAQMERMNALGITPIVGLIHHGCGPLDTNLLRPDFADRFASYARAVSERYPWVTQYTPINEPLTTARFSTLYGFWHPHLRSAAAFMRATLNQVHAIRLAMAAIRTVNSSAQLVQTEDLGTIRSTAALQYQADFENERRWLTFDLLTRRVVSGHPLYDYALHLGVSAADIECAVAEGCPPNILGINHYVTSDRWLDEDAEQYPSRLHGGNGRQVYADVEAVRVVANGAADRRALLLEAWRRYQLPLALTEVHLGCTREQQLRWLNDGWSAAVAARAAGADVRAVTAWAAFGTRDWTSLVTRLDGHYEPGLFDVRSPVPRATVLSHFAKARATGVPFEHPVLAGSGWWECPQRFVFHETASAPSSVGGNDSGRAPGKPLLIAGASGSLGRAFTRLCAERGLAFRALDRKALDIADRNSVENALLATRAWAVINCAGYARVDDAEANRDACHRANVAGAEILAAACAEHAIPLLTFSSDLVFDGGADSPYTESARVSPLGVYGESKVEAERRVVGLLPSALVVRTAAFFSPWEDNNFVTRMLQDLERGDWVCAPDDLTISPTFLPDLVHVALDLLIDREHGIWHLTNSGSVTWAELAHNAAGLAGIDTSRLHSQSHACLALPARRPRFSALASDRGALMPSIDDALRRYALARPWTSNLQPSCIR